MAKEKLYLIPGLMCDERLWSRMTPYLEKKYDFIYLKLPLSINFDEMSDILDTQINEESINLVGFSLGGYLAMHFSLKYPNKVGKLFILAGSGANMTDDELAKRRESILQGKKIGFTGLTKEKISTLIDVNSINDDEMIKLIQDMFLDLGEKVYDIQIESTLYRRDLMDDIQKSNKQINFIYGNKDRLVKTKWIEELQSKRDKNIKFECLNTTSHNIPLDFPKEITDFILSN